jgi:L-alanine-DL-glutamate epimerase-like enolase superfamily enzyme
MPARDGSVWAVALFDRVADLPVVVEGYELEGLERVVSSGFLRKSTVIRLFGGGEQGVGEDVTYDAELHDAQQALGPVLELAGSCTFASLSERLGELDLFPAGAPGRDVFRRYRRWGFESAALDLALRQSARPLHGLLGRSPRPVRFVVSSRLGDPPTIAPVASRLGRYPGLRFKLDATPAWTDELIAELQQLDCVDSIDFKGQYHGTVVDNPTDPDLYRRVAEAFPRAWLEDPDLDAPGARDALAAHLARITWDAPIHDVQDIVDAPVVPRTVNLKPSRFGSVRSLFAAYEYCEAQGMGAYGGGQYELGVGRDQIQVLAAIFHPDGPNDIAPGGYDALDPEPGLPSSPLDAAPAATGFRRA